MKFDKMEGLGNDFIVVDGTADIRPDLVRELCDRRRGIGADGLLQVRAADGQIVMGYWNADGSAAEMCGNGLRCVARYAFDHGLVDDKLFTVRTPRGPLRVEVREDPRVELGRVEVGSGFEFENHRFQWVSVGNPHAVAIVEDLEREEVAGIGGRLERSTPGGTNVELAEVRDKMIELKIWERGVGETLACGSGMVAAAAVAQNRGLIDSEVSVTVPGGVGLVELTGDTSYLTGPARYVFAGEI
jgi:diaminopimelate epimerase